MASYNPRFIIRRPAIPPQWTPMTLRREERNIYHLSEAEKKGLLHRPIFVNIYCRIAADDTFVLAADNVSLNLLWSFCLRARQDIGYPTGDLGTMPNPIRWELTGFPAEDVKQLVLFLINSCQHQAQGRVGSIPCQTKSCIEWMAIFDAAYRLGIPCAVHRLRQQMAQDMSSVNVEDATACHDCCLRLGLAAEQRDFAARIFSLACAGVRLQDIKFLERSRIAGDVKLLGMRRSAERVHFTPNWEQDEADLDRLDEEVYGRVKAVWDELQAANEPSVAGEGEEAGRRLPQGRGA